MSEEEEERLEQGWYDKKSAIMESILGKEHDMVMHAIVPYFLGGTLDLFYFPNGIKGTGIATKELSYACQESPSNARYDSYELVMFVKESLDLDAANDETTAFGRAHKKINVILNAIARYSEQAMLNPKETIEFPEDWEVIGGTCLIIDSYEPTGSVSNDINFGLMLIIEVFRSEMEFAMNNGGALLIRRLKEDNIYPYSNLNRESVV